ncbi:hypothetical protein [Lysobacter solisilvae (ex Woo and Kim 2020)]|uniref:DUF1761 domain-containing protein n=1 Tax=Agrilutibacter terrestris TaxID=2865112 RepID=A0A7H0FYL8_9GAMM|nr:hypothetical protein [Lysobacter terrestris]QNP41134.1 hypothetical protein H8B22_02595 [Lysobacter terrestris]
MDKRFWISGVVMTIATALLGFVVHGLLLADDYNALVGTVMRSQEQANGMMQWMLLADACIGFAMTWIYRQGIGARSTLAQGIRFGIAVAFLTVIPQFLIYWVVTAMPAALVHKQLVFDSLRMVALGVLVAWLNPRRA